MIAQRVLLALPVGVFVASVVLLFWRVPRRLGPRLDPYTVGQRVRLGERDAELEVLLPPPPASAFARFFGPMLRSVEDRVSRFLGHRDEAATARALEHAGLDDVTPRQFRDQQFAFAMAGVLLGVVSGVLSGPRTGLMIAAFAVPIGFMRKRNALERLIKLRRERMRAELWQVNGLLAVKLHASLNVQAVISEFVAEAHGEIADELRRVLVAIETGAAGERALRDQAERTAEPFAARLYRVLADGIEKGGNISHALLDQASDIRHAHRDDRLHAATVRTVVMAGPSVLMAAVMMLLVGAPAVNLLFNIT